MRKFILNITTFGIFTLVFYIVLIIFSVELLPPTAIPSLRNYENEYTKQRFTEVESKRNIDILVLGSSRAYRHYDPRIFSEYGYKIFNLGSSGQTFLQTEVLVKKYFDQLNPKFVIFDVHPVTFSEDGSSSTMDLLINTAQEKDLYQLAWAKKHLQLYNNLILLNYRKIFHREGTLRKDKNIGDFYIEGGYVENKSSQVDHTTLRTRIKPKNNKQIKAFNKIISTFREKNVDFILIQSPLTAVQNEFVNEVNNDEKIFANTGNYINYNKLINLPEDHFLDHAHLNQRGVEVFNQELLLSLKIPQNQSLKRPLSFASE